MAEGIVISYRESNRYQYLAYQDGERSKPMKRYQELSKPLFNKIQQKLYAEIVYGLKAFSDKQLAEMSKNEVKRIESTHFKVQVTLNNWKQEITYQRVDKLLLALFPKSPIVKRFASVKGPHPKIIDGQTFKDLGLSQTQIAQKLVSEGFLPENFFSIGLNS